MNQTEPAGRLFSLGEALAVSSQRIPLPFKALLANVRPSPGRSATSRRESRNKGSLRHS